MMQTLLTITPIFILIALGWVAFKAGFLPQEILSPLNRLIFYFAIPAFLFNAISKFPLEQGLNITVLLALLGIVFTCYLSGWLFCKAAKAPSTRSGPLVQGACHGNLGYIGLPVAYYFLGDAGLAQTGILAGFLMILQNVMSITILQSFATGSANGKKSAALIKLLQNPIILSSMIGIIVSKFQIPVPEVIFRSCKMLGQMAPPAALLLIGAALSFKTIRSRKLAMLYASAIKLLILPSLGLLLFTLLNIETVDYLPALILLSTPTATVAYIMARQMRSDMDIAAGMISMTTLLSALTIPVWLTILTQ